MGDCWKPLDKPSNATEYPTIRSVTTFGGRNRAHPTLSHLRLGQWMNRKFKAATTGGINQSGRGPATPGAVQQRGTGAKGTVSRKQCCQLGPIHHRATAVQCDVQQQ
uniref:Uncharacterized protein n=1 Tax=Anopheles atroparvus TaxID=41427 RepID=A0A182JC81_ANOAO